MGQMTITLPDELVERVKLQTRKSQYGSYSDFIRDAIRDKLNDGSDTMLELMQDNNALLRLILEARRCG